MYEKGDRTKGRLMLVDIDLLDYFVNEPPLDVLDHDRAAVPHRLRTEYDNFGKGYVPGPLMMQQQKFKTLETKNKAMKQQITQKTLQTLQTLPTKLHPEGTAWMCYCVAPVPESGIPKDAVVCAHRDCDVEYFHKSCVRKLNVEKSSRWLCTACETKMDVLVRQTLRDLGFTDIPPEKTFHDCFSETFQGIVDEKFQSAMGETVHSILGMSDAATIGQMAKHLRDAVSVAAALKTK